MPLVNSMHHPITLRRYHVQNPFRLPSPLASRRRSWRQHAQAATPADDANNQAFEAIRATLREYRALQSALRPWVQQQMVLTGRRPTSQDVERSGINWVQDYYRRLMLARQKLFVEIPALRESLASPQQGTPSTRPDSTPTNANKSASGSSRAAAAKLGRAIGYQHAPAPSTPTATVQQPTGEAPASPSTPPASAATTEVAAGTGGIRFMGQPAAVPLDRQSRPVQYTGQLQHASPASTAEAGSAAGTPAAAAPTTPAPYMPPPQLSPCLHARLHAAAAAAAPPSNMPAAAASTVASASSSSARATVSTAPPPQPPTPPGTSSSSHAANVAATSAPSPPPSLSALPATPSATPSPPSPAPSQPTSPTPAQTLPTAAAAATAAAPKTPAALEAPSVPLPASDADARIKSAFFAALKYRKTKEVTPGTAPSPHRPPIDLSANAPAPPPPGAPVPEKPLVVAGQFRDPRSNRRARWLDDEADNLAEAAAEVAKLSPEFTAARQQAPATLQLPPLLQPQLQQEQQLTQQQQQLRQQQQGQAMQPQLQQQQEQSTQQQGQKQQLEGVGNAVLAAAVSRSSSSSSNGGSNGSRNGSSKGRSNGSRNGSAAAVSVSSSPVVSVSGNGRRLAAASSSDQPCAPLPSSGDKPAAAIGRLAANSRTGNNSATSSTSSHGAPEGPKAGTANAPGLLQASGGLPATASSYSSSTLRPAWGDQALDEDGALAAAAAAAVAQGSS